MYPMKDKQKIMEYEKEKKKRIKRKKQWVIRNVVSDSTEIYVLQVQVVASVVLEEKTRAQGIIERRLFFM